MELRDQRHIQIFHTLEKLERLNEAIQFHTAQESIDQLAVEQYKEQKVQLTEDLVQLLREIDLSLEVAA